MSMATGRLILRETKTQRGAGRRLRHERARRGPLRRDLRAARVLERLALEPDAASVARGRDAPGPGKESGKRSFRKALLLGTGPNPHDAVRAAPRRGWKQDSRLA